MSPDENLIGSPSERGKMSRRELLSTTIMAAAATRSVVAAQATGPSAGSTGLVKPDWINHLHIHVHNFARTERFYRRMFGFAPLVLWGYTFDWPVILGFRVPPGQYISYAEYGSYAGYAESVTGGIGKSARVDHYGIGSEPYDRARMEREIEPLGAPRHEYHRNYGIIADPDGIGFQVGGQPRSGATPRSGIDTFYKSMLEVTPGQETPPYEVSGPQDLKRIRNSAQEYPVGVTKPQENGLAGVQIYSANLRRSEQFYRTLYGVRFGKVQFAGRSVGVGFTLPSGQYLSFEENRPAAGQVAHFAIRCNAFDASRMAKEVEPLAPKRTASDKNAGIFRDPDGLGILLDTGDARKR
jgi:catechol 2,3-dioxygenase-like lactoylglutathione lyase family enzyme